MALISCPECGRENVSENAEMCLSCGYGVKAHFDEIKLQEETAKQKILKEQKQKEEELQDKLKLEKKLAAIELPKEPEIELWLIGTGLALLFFFALFDLAGLGLFFGSVCLMGAILNYSNSAKTYNQAMEDTQKYKEETLDYRESKFAREYSEWLNPPTCPTCKSQNIAPISTLSRAVSVKAVGLASSKISKSMECKRCGYKW